jgi:hypothetical protein
VFTSPDRNGDFQKARVGDTLGQKKTCGKFQPPPINIKHAAFTNRRTPLRMSESDQMKQKKPEKDVYH